METKQKKQFFWSHRKSSALIVSIAIHAVLIAVALTFVAVKVYVKPEDRFLAKEVKRPRMQLRKLQVPVKQMKRTQAPKLRKTIISKPKINVDIKMPEVIGVLGGTGYGTGGGLGSLGFGFDLDLFGGGTGGGNEFVGTFYDLKQSPDGDPTDIGRASAKDPGSRATQLMACKVIKGFVGSGFNENRLRNYFKAPKLKYSTAFMMPSIPADAAPKAFGVEDKVKGRYWVCYYKGQIAAPETGQYRFWGIGDDILIVRVARRVVLDASWPELIKQATSWSSVSDDNRKFLYDESMFGAMQLPTGMSFLDVYENIDKAGGYNGSMIFKDAFNQTKIPLTYENYMRLGERMVVGNWISLRKGEPIDVDILIGEIPGGKFACRLLIQEKGKNYKTVQSDAGPQLVLPIFKTAPINEKLVPKMKLDPHTMTLNGPDFGVVENTKNTGRNP